MKRIFPILLACSGGLSHAGTAAENGELRTWTNDEGRTIEAELLELNDEGEVTLRLDNGREYTLPLDTLSDDDAEWAREWQARQEALAAAPDPAVETVMTKPGKLLFESSFAEIDGEWHIPHGDWQPGEEGMVAKELAEDDHAAVFKRGLPLEDVIIEYELRLAEATKNTSFSIDDDKDHLCRVMITPDGFQARKDDNDHEGPDEAKPFNRVNLEMDPDDWYTVHIELRGEEMLASIDDEISLGRDPIIERTKARWGFTVAGGPVHLRNLTIWEALPNEEWEDERDRLYRRLDIEE